MSRRGSGEPGQARVPAGSARGGYDAVHHGRVRVFAALTPPATAIDHLEHALLGVRRDDVEWRWVLPDRWHLTLAFYGEVSELTADRVALRLERVAGRQARLQ